MAFHAAQASSTTLPLTLENNKTEKALTTETLATFADFDGIHSRHQSLKSLASLESLASLGSLRSWDLEDPERRTSKEPLDAASVVQSLDGGDETDCTSDGDT
jgi:hypothetical protein